MGISILGNYIRKDSDPGAEILQEWQRETWWAVTVTRRWRVTESDSLILGGWRVGRREENGLGATVRGKEALVVSGVWRGDGPLRGALGVAGSLGDRRAWVRLGDESDVRLESEGLGVLHTVPLGPRAEVEGKGGSRGEEAPRPRATSHLLPGAGHMLPFTLPAALRERFWESLVRAGGESPGSPETWAQGQRSAPCGWSCSPVRLCGWHLAAGRARHLEPGCVASDPNPTP